MHKIKIGILFGGPSREREISFAGGRTVYDNLNKGLFEPVPIFVDSFKNFILLDWEYIYKGSIRDFYPATRFQDSKYSIPCYIESFSEKIVNESINEIGKKIELHELSTHIDFAFLGLHGEFGEDGQIQALMESVNIPYSGSGILPSAMGMDKGIQKKLMHQAIFEGPKMLIIKRENWDSRSNSIYHAVNESVGFPCVIRPANQGSSIGVSICDSDLYLSEFNGLINAAFFIEEINIIDWNKMSASRKITKLLAITDIRSGLGFPLTADGETRITHPDSLMDYLNNSPKTKVKLEADSTDSSVIIESFIYGKEFSCIVVKDDAQRIIALPPTEIKKGKEVFDYRSKYLPGLSRKVTPIDLPFGEIEKIREECTRLYSFLGFNVYARIDGFYTESGRIFLNDPNTTSGMLPSSFFFHQAAEIGLNPSEFLTFLIRNSLNERINNSLTIRPSNIVLLATLDKSIVSHNQLKKEKKKIGVIMGGYSFERHISVESGRNIYEKLTSSDKYTAIPLFLYGNEDGYALYRIPISLLLKDNADDISDKIKEFHQHEIINKIQEECAPISAKYINASFIKKPIKWSFEKLKEEVDGVFIALHGRPGEDGTLQRELDRMHIPYNGSMPLSSSVTINKFLTGQKLREQGYSVADQILMTKDEYRSNADEAKRKILKTNSFPFIVKPVDDGCSSAVKLVKDEESLGIYLDAIFRDSAYLDPKTRIALELKYNEEFPFKKRVLIENLITANGASNFLEITVGLLTHHDKEGKISYEIFEPSETLSSGAILSLEEKFLAGEGQNITPARFGKTQEDYNYISAQIKKEIENIASFLNILGYARIDAFIRISDENVVELIVIEVNSLPGMTPATCIFHQSAINGYKPYEFIDKILEFGMQNKKELV